MIRIIVQTNFYIMSIIVAAFSGSLRKESYTTKLVKAFQQLAPVAVTVQIIDISKLPFINQDLETDTPQTVKDLNDSIDRADAILLATPEYNRSYSPILKNALDWGSRPEGQNKWNGKPVAIIGCTPYALGAFGAQNHLRQVVMYLNMPVLQQPEFYLGNAGDKFNDHGDLTDEQTYKKISELWGAFIQWINKIK
jgi:chromate reductase, NAD(P)H dehydrogenase (quinone)